ncbi:MAG: AAA family ATPase [Methylococcales bacterium]
MNKNSLLIQSLQNPSLYPHDIEYIRVIETHISWVLLTGHYAYKIKKPLDLGFLDFSSLDKRRHYCLEELRLNSRLAPDIYLDVVTINGTEQQPIIDGSGTVIEYAVKMHQFENDQTFDLLLVQNQLTSEYIKQTAKIIATFHSRIERAAADAEFGNADTIMQFVRENFSQILLLDGIERMDSLDQLESWSEQQYAELQAFFRQRKQSGFVRECHGDLHLGNIALISGQVVPFDGIEFNPSLYWIDVMSEVAFLVMDLQDKQRYDLAFQFLNEYLQHSGDYDGLKLLRFYLVYRAIVRAKVNAIRANQNTSAKEHQQATSSYYSYLKLANRYTQTSTPLMMIMHGVSGSGKSWLSEKIITRCQAIRIRSDVERKRLHNLSPQQKTHLRIAGDLYSQSSSDMTYSHLLQLAVKIITAGYIVIVDATFLQQQQRKLFSQQAEAMQVPFLIVHTQTDEQTLIQRINDRARQLNNVSDADQTILENQLQTMQTLGDEELKCTITVDTNNNSHLCRLWELLVLRQ